MSYAILKYRLMDIRLVLKRATLLALIYALLAILLLPLFWPFFKGVFILAGSQWWKVSLGILFAGAVLSIGPFLYAYLIRSTTFFREKVITGVTHEFKSPLGSIKSAVEILLEDAGKKTINRQRLTEFLLMIQNNADRLGLFIQGLLDLSKIEQAQVKLFLEPTDLKELARKCIQLFKPISEKKGLSVALKAEDLPMVSCDQEKIQQVISNLLSNALKFTDQGTILVQITEEGEEVRIAIQDTGRGIPPKELERIFEKFYQVPMVSPNPEGSPPFPKGAGLGLSIAKGWVEAHQGRIWAESEGLGRGTRFVFTLPAGH